MKVVEQAANCLAVSYDKSQKAVCVYLAEIAFTFEYVPSMFAGLDADDPANAPIKNVIKASNSATEGVRHNIFIQRYILFYFMLAGLVSNR
jgi:hypothetical protein